MPEPQVTREQAGEVSSTPLPAAVALLNKVLNGGNFLALDSGPLRLNGNGYSSATKGGTYFGIFADTGQNDYFDPEAVQATWYYGDLSRYVAGTGESGGRYDYQDFFGVAGITTPDADMSDLRATQGMAVTYRGFDAQGRTDTPNVEMIVDFGTGEIRSGSFNRGVDGGNVYTFQTAAGKAVGGAVGFEFTGVITGSNFKSTSLSAKDGAVTGAVTGAFFGPKAAAAGGVADITKSRTDGTYTDSRFVSPFLAIKDLAPDAIRRNND